MPTLPITGPVPLDGGALPVNGDADVLAVFPADVRRAATAPVRDALVAAFAEIQKEYQRRARQAAALSDPLRSVETHLAGLAADHEVFRQPGESDEALRARILGAPDMVTPVAILAAVNAIVARATPKRAKYFESELDQMFVSASDTDDEQCFVHDGFVSTGPRYLARLYADDAALNGGDVIADRDPGGAWVFGQDEPSGRTFGRYFVLRIPPLEAVDDDGAYVLDAISASAESAMMFLANGSDTSGAESDGTVTSFIFTDQALSDELYAAIVSVVELLKGQGIRWQAYVDPGL